MDSTDLKAASRRAGDHPALETAARVGYAVNGVLHIVIGVIALQLALGSKGKSADQSGALGSMADNGFGPAPAVGRRRRVAGSGAVAGHRGDHGWVADERPRQGSREGGRLPRPVVDGVQVRERQRDLEQEPDHRLHGEPHEAARGPVARGCRRPRHHRCRRLPRRQGVEEEVPPGPRDPPRASGSSRPVASATSPRASPSPSSAASSSWPPCVTSRARPAASTGPCATCLGAPGGPVLLASRRPRAHRLRRLLLRPRSPRRRLSPSRSAGDRQPERHGPDGRRAAVVRRTQDGLPPARCPYASRVQAGHHEHDMCERGHHECSAAPTIGRRTRRAERPVVDPPAHRRPRSLDAARPTTRRRLADDASPAA